MTESNVDHLFQHALSLTKSEGAEFLSRLSAGDREAVEALLKADQSANDQRLYEGIAEPADDAKLQSTFIQPDETPDLPDRIGNYKILQQIGEGGMGSVYMAEQTRPVKRRVALKVIKAGMGSKEVIARFEAERQALAMMDHPNIAKVLDAGTTDDQRPYFVMELVRGIPITRYCDENRLTPNERLAIFIKVCRAIQHAHQKGIIHRDIKPTNVLVGQADGEPFPKVIDFGLAKALQSQNLTDKTMFTQFGQVVGTLEYMSPEQAEMNIHDVDTRTDVYSLGVLLYELLTGSTPITRERLKGAALDRIIQLIREEDAPRPSLRLSDSGDEITGISEQRRMDPKRLGAILKGDLDWIAIKALEKDRKRRYDGAGSLADDVKRYLGDEAIEARPPSFGYRFVKTFRRHRFAVLASTGMLLLLIAGLVGTVSMWLLADNEAKRARRSEGTAANALAESEKAGRLLATKAEELEFENYRLSLQTAYGQLLSGEIDAASDTLKTSPEKFRGWEWRYLKAESRPTLNRIKLPKNVAARSPTGRHFLSVDDPRNGQITLRLIQAVDGAEEATLTVPGRSILLADISFRASRIAILAKDDASGDNSTLYCWDPSARSLEWTFQSGPSRTGTALTGVSLSISTDGSTVMASGLDFTEEVFRKPLGRSANAEWIFRFEDGLLETTELDPFKANDPELGHNDSFIFRCGPFSTPSVERIGLMEDEDEKLPRAFSDMQRLPVESVYAIKANRRWRIFDKNMKLTDSLGELSDSDFGDDCAFYAGGKAVAFLAGNELFARTGEYQLRIGFVPATCWQLLADYENHVVFAYTDGDVLTYPLPSPQVIFRLASLSERDRSSAGEKSIAGKYCSIGNTLVGEAEKARDEAEDDFVGDAATAIRNAETGKLIAVDHSGSVWHQTASGRFYHLRGTKLINRDGPLGGIVSEVNVTQSFNWEELHGLILALDGAIGCAFGESGEWPNTTGRCVIFYVNSGKVVSELALVDSERPIALTQRQFWTLREDGIWRHNLNGGDTVRIATATAAGVSSDSGRLAFADSNTVKLVSLPSFETAQKHPVRTLSEHVYCLGCS